MTRKSAFLAPPTISEAIYQHLKKEIIEGRLQPNQRLQPKEIAKLFNVSSTPVRDAFLRLVSEGYLVLNARKGILVHEKTMAEVKQLYEIVRALDKIALRSLLRTTKKETIDSLKEMTRKLSEYYEANDAHSYLRQNLKIHETIWKECANKFLYDTLVQVMEKIAIYRTHNNFAPFSSRSAIEKSHKDHLNIIEFIEAGDIGRLEQVIDLHWGEEFFAEKPTGDS
jgi:DNA-binding GntR family transcriptional regulator